ncbi:inactive serine protease PAMR1 isoform X2 [Gouania willdenowi]|uniref:Inactive serine protease PAMR1 n=1 Tax=Gouania willdenowi TaxID=441366 RepID=A0A8C5G7M1_GOUWI|nr:inactive serine protease PAMR1 isoform X2 [Gouania willdenowi]
MLSAGRRLQLAQTHGGARSFPWNHIPVSRSFLFFISLFVVSSLPRGAAWPYDYRYMYNNCPGPEWNVMCRACCEYDVIRCKCPLQGTKVGYAVPCCRNAINECDPCIIHPGCSIFENCKRCNNGTWGPRDNFFITGQYCAECRPGWSGGDCMKCGGVIHKRQGHLVLEGYPNNARCEWTIQVDKQFTIELRFRMLSLEFHPTCRYDYVEVRDGDSINSGVIARYCGNKRPVPIQSSGSNLHILFVSDGYKNFDGLFATFQESSACSSSPCLHDGTCILDSSYTYHCACLAGYTGKRCENVVGCRRPPVPTHGSTEGLFHHSAARVTFRCDPGFELQGFHSAICLIDGTWSAPAPKCVPMERFCTLPPKPAHGDHFLVFGPNDVLIALQYLCHQPYELNGSSQRTCLQNNTWSGTPPFCSKVNNTLTERGRGKEVDVNTDKNISENKNVDDGGKDIISSHENLPKVNTRDESTGTIPEKTTAEGGKEEKTNPGSNSPDGPDVEPDGLDNNLYQVIEKDRAEEKPLKPESGEIPVTKDKGQEEKERKEEQVNGKKDSGKVSPNDTKMRIILSEGENTVETFKVEMTKNDTVQLRTKPTINTNNTTAGKKILPTHVNITLYRAGGDVRTTKEKISPTQEQPERDSRKTQEESEKAKEKQKEREINQSFSACREPKVSELVRQKVLPPQTPSRKTPLHKLYSSALQTQGSTNVPPVLPQLPSGFHHLYTHIEYECASQFYQHSGSPRRTCLKTGKWSGRHVSCSPVCGKLPTFVPERPEESLWPWLAAIYRRSTKGAGMKVSKAVNQAGTLKRNGGGGISGDHQQDSEWQLVCSGALINQRSLVVAAHCVTELSKVYPLDATEVKVVMGKHYREDSRENKGLQHLRVASILVHPNYDPNILDSDIAVIKLLDKAKIGPRVLPLCLQENQELELTPGPGLVTGWSPLPDSNLGSDEKARVGLVHLADIVPCEQQYARNGVPVSVTENMLCASQKPDYSPANICPSDTGGILVLPGVLEGDDKDGKEQRLSYAFTQASKGSKGLWRLLGLVSFGYDDGECNPNLYTVYTRVASFKDWIESNMK